MEGTLFFEFREPITLFSTRPVRLMRQPHTVSTVFKYLALLLTFSLFPEDLFAQNEWTNRPQAPGEHYIMIDANTGERVAGNTRFKEGANVTVYFVNMNPFRYAYQFKLKSAPLARTDVQGFLKLVGVSLPGGTFNSADLSPDTPPPTCQSVADNLLLQIASFTKNYDDFLQATKGQGIPDDKIEAVKKDATGLRDLLKQREDLKKKWDGALDDIKKQSGCTGTITNEAEIEKALKAIEDNEASFNLMYALLQKALESNGSPLYARRAAEVLDGPTGVTITLETKDLRLKDAGFESVAAPTLRIGEEHRITVTAGLGMSTFRHRKIIRQKGKVLLKSVKLFVEDAEGNPEKDDMGNPIRRDSLDANGNLVYGTRNVFGLEEKGPSVALAVVLLNGQLLDLGNLLKKKRPGVVSLNASIGTAVVTGGGESVGVELLFGGSVGLLNNQLMLSVLAHRGRRERIDPASGFKIGDPVPPDLSDPLPIRKDTKTNVLFAVTYRF